MKMKPRLGCAGIITRDDKFLLGVRAKEPNMGKWILPGGGVNFCETFSETLQREIKEEASINIKVNDLFNIYELIDKPNEHRVIIYMKGEYISGDINPNSDLSEVKFLSKDEIKKLDEKKLISSFVRGVLIDAGIL